MRTMNNLYLTVIAAVLFLWHNEAQAAPAYRDQTRESAAGFLVSVFNWRHVTTRGTSSSDRIATITRGAYTNPCLVSFQYRFNDDWEEHWTMTADFSTIADISSTGLEVRLASQVLSFNSAETAARFVYAAEFLKNQCRERALSQAPSFPSPRDAEARLRATITALQAGTPDYGGMAPELARAIRAQSGVMQELAALGELRRLDYINQPTLGEYHFRATFATGQARTWRIIINREGRVDGLWVE